MSFAKKVLVLKELEKGYSIKDKNISGIIRIEKEKEDFTIFSSIINASRISFGEYFLFLIDENNEVFCFNLGSRPDFFTKLLDGKVSINALSVGLAVVENYIPLTIAFATDRKDKDALCSFKKEIANFFLVKSQEEQLAQANNKSEPELTPLEDFPEPSPIKPPYPPAEDPNPTITPPEEFPANDIKEKLYNDEAVATENYFEIEEQLTSKLNELKEADFRIEESFLEEIGRDNKYSNSNRYYDTVCSELEQIFNKFPEEQQLKKTFSKSRWAKVYYSDTKYYVVGVIKESGKEKYICYGVPATYSKTPPKELDGYCTFIPLSIFSLLGDGYWMMFQDAVTGECIKPK